MGHDQLLVPVPPVSLLDAVAHVQPLLLRRRARAAGVVVLGGHGRAGRVHGGRDVLDYGADDAADRAEEDRIGRCVKDVAEGTYVRFDTSRHL